ncbi:MAG: hypothetical protein JW790_05270 [Dehalococcoidales bacterium]|jgi:hypothetical protein|nr:hypothetical protein [Dehalococcoidales bacterium]
MAVKVSRALYEEIMKIKESGEVDINDAKAVLKYAKANNLNVAVRAIEGNPRRYLCCINEGMEVGDFF